MDFGFILDGSGSISRRNWQRIKEFVKEIVDSFDVSAEGTHFSLLEYSNEPTVYLKFNDFADAQLNAVNIKRRIDEVSPSGEETYIDKALTLASEEIFTEEGGMRPNVKKVCLHPYQLHWFFHRPLFQKVTAILIPVSVIKRSLI